MLDKSVECVDILMKRPKGTPIRHCELPEGFRYVFYKPGDELNWCAMHISTLGLNEIGKGLRNFKKEFLSSPDMRPENRMLFIEAPNGEKIGTGTAWKQESEGGRIDPWLRSIALKPKYQGIGLGKAIVSRVMELMLELDGDHDYYLHTQTWSHVAARIYLKTGFEITHEKNLYMWSNKDSEHGVEVLRSLGLPV